LRASGAEHVWLDATMIDDFPNRFPTIWGACLANELDPTIDWLPVAPAAHYLCGGVVTDLDGATTVPHLWACGETACSGVHGANRLASNSLLDGLVFGHRVMMALQREKSAAEPTGAMQGVLELSCLGATAKDPELLPQADAVDPDAVRSAVQRLMSRDAGVIRDATTLHSANDTLSDLLTVTSALPARDPRTYEALNVLRVAHAIARGALAREESRGCHTREDYPKSSKRQLGRYVLCGEETPEFVAFETVKAKVRR
jgi:L-aspartate oxidase